MVPSTMFAAFTTWPATCRAGSRTARWAPAELSSSIVVAVWRIRARHDTLTWPVPSTCSPRRRRCKRFGRARRLLLSEPAAIPWTESATSKSPPTQTSRTVRCPSDSHASRVVQRGEMPTDTAGRPADGIRPELGDLDPHVLVRLRPERTKQRGPGRAKHPVGTTPQANDLMRPPRGHG